MAKSRVQVCILAQVKLTVGEDVCIVELIDH